MSDTPLTDAQIFGISVEMTETGLKMTQVPAPGVGYVLADFARELERRLAAMTKERDSWKIAHDNQVNLRRTLMDRPDLQDRAARMQELIAERDALLSDIAAITQ